MSSNLPHGLTETATAPHDATRTTESPQCQPTFQHQSLVTKVSPKWSSTRKQIIWLYKSYQTNIITTISDSNHLQYFFKTTVLWHFSICRATFSMATEGRNFTSIQSSSPSRATSSDIKAPRGLFQVIFKPLEGSSSYLQVTFKTLEGSSSDLQVRWNWAIWGKLWEEKEGIYVIFVWSFSPIMQCLPTRCAHFLKTKIPFWNWFFLQNFS